MSVLCFFFFSSRRRHTRWPRDWSSDVCSSDLHFFKHRSNGCMVVEIGRNEDKNKLQHVSYDLLLRERCNEVSYKRRSEERRVGKECKSQMRGCHDRARMYEKHIRRRDAISSDV